MTVIIQMDFYWALTAPHITHMTSLTSILVVYFVTSLGFAFSLNINWQTDIVVMCCLAA